MPLQLCQTLFSVSYQSYSRNHNKERFSKFCFHETNGANDIYANHKHVSYQQGYNSRNET